MDSEWLIQDQHHHEERLPKVLMVGELNVAIVGQRVTMLFLSDHIVLRIENFRSAFQLRNQAIPALIGKLLLRGGLGLKLQVGQRKAMDVFPKPGWIVRWLIPAVRKIVRSSKN